MTESPGSQVSQHVPRMYRVAFRLLADADKAHDAVQEACLKALARMDEFDGRATLATWLHRITVNCARDAARSEGRREARDRQPQAGRESVVPSPAQTAEKNETSELAWRLVGQLPEECRSAFELTQLDGYSYDEAARIEDQPRGTIASRVYRAKKILLEQMNARTDGRARP
jgi:RNA polymerase sigma-70 factor (ECF subfamily)